MEIADAIFNFESRDKFYARSHVWKHGIGSVRPNYTFALGPFVLKVGPLLLKSILMNIMDI
jgi:hypothetical protein